MATIQDLLKLDLSQVKDTELLELLKSVIIRYNNLTGKARDTYLKEAQENITMFYEIVKESFPKAIQKTEQKPTKTPSKSKASQTKKTDKISSKTKKILLLFLGDFEGIYEELTQADIDEADLVLFVEMTDALKEALESGDETKITAAIEDAKLTFEAWQQNMMESKAGNSEALAEKAKQSMNDLLKTLKMPLIKDGEKTGTVKLRPFAKKVMQQFDDWYTDYEDRMGNVAKETLADLTLDFRLALKEKEGIPLRTALNETIVFYEMNIQLQDTKIEAEADALIKSLKDAIYEDELQGDTPKQKPTALAEPEAVIFSEALVRAVSDELFEFANGLTAKDNALIIKTGLALEEAITEETSIKGLKEKTRITSLQFIKDLAKIGATIDKTPAIEAINPLLNALGESLLEADGKQDKETEHQRNKRILEELAALQPELDKCRTLYLEANRKKREAKGDDKPKSKPTRLTKLKTKTLSLVQIIPPKLKDNLRVQDETKAILLKTYWDLVKLWNMDTKRAKAGAEAIEEKFEAMEEKTEKKNA